MVRKLRFKFITVAMLSVLFAISLLMFIINYMNYQNVVDRTDWTLTVLVKNKGTFPESMFAPEKESTSSKDIPKQKKKGLPWDRNSSDRSYLFRKQLEDKKNALTIPFESRYFSVLVNSENQIQEIDASQLLSMDEETSTTLLARAATSLSAQKRYVFIDGYRCAKVSENSGTRYIFLDCTRSLESFRTFRNLSILVSILGLSIVFVLLSYFSKRILRPVEESYEKQRRFITDAGHEIRTPLTIINADISVIEMDQEGACENEWLQDIKQQTARLSTLTEELVYLTRMEEVQKDSLNMKPFDFSTTVSDVASSFDARAKVTGKFYEYHVSEGIMLRGNQSSIQKLTSILLDNAFKYSTDEGNIRMDAVIRGKNLFLTVRNDVDSMDPESIPHLFDRFYRADDSRNSESGGHGIGLSIAQAVVHAHGGKIGAYSDDGSSLRITATIPLL